MELRYDHTGPQNEAERSRQEALVRYRILDSEPEEAFDRAVRVVAEVLEAPIAFISFIDNDRQWFKASIGLEQKETPRHLSLCQYCIQGSDVLEINDLSAHPRFKDTPIVEYAPFVRAYLGAPIIDPKGNALGSVCVVDTQVRDFEEKERTFLAHQADHVMTLLENRLESKLRGELEHDLSKKVVEAEDEVRERIGRDIHDGLAQRITVADLFLQRLKEITDPQDPKEYDKVVRTIEETLKEAATEARGVSHDLTLKAVERAELREELQRLIRPFDGEEKGLRVNFEERLGEEDLPPFVKKNVYRIVQEILQNALKHSDASKLELQVELANDGLHLEACDDGKGLKDEEDAPASVESIRGRVKALAGDVRIESLPDKGVRHEIRVPLE